MNDFETVRERLCDHHTREYVWEAQAALDRIEAEIERLNATNVALAEELVKEVTKVERLRAALEQIEHAFGRIARAALAKEEA